MKKENLKKIIHHLVTITDRDKDKIEVSPLRDWYIVTVLFGAGFIFSVWYHTYLFMNINEDNFFSMTATVTSEPVSSINDEKITKTILLFDTQDAEFERLKAASVTITDPSR